MGSRSRSASRPRFGSTEPSRSVHTTSPWNAVPTELTVTGRVEQGTVVSISSVDFASDLRFALNEHAAWLQVNRRAEYEEQCLDDVFARTCSELLVATVGQWQESSGE